MKKSLIAWGCALVWMLSACDNTQKNTSESTANTNDTTNSNQQAAAEAKDTLGRPQEMGWSEVQPYDLPVVRTYTEVAMPEITVHGNERYTSYGLQNEVLFDEGKSTIKRSAEAKLKQIGESIGKRYPKQEIRIFGYTDSIASKAENMKLSEERAKAVRDWMVKNAKVDSSRISIHPMGESKPVASNATEAGRKENRRVEIVVRNQ